MILSRFLSFKSLDLGTFFFKVYFLVVFILSAPVSFVYGQVKQRASYYTETKIRNAAENIRRYPWARKEKDEAVARADRWLSYCHYNLDSLWSMIPSQKIPRAYAVNSLGGCLVCGTAINKYGNYSYLYDESKIDWKLTCPHCHLTFPTNDFKSYYKGGLDQYGNFDPQQARLANEALVKKGEEGYLINRYAVTGLSAEQKRNLKSAGVSDSLIHRITTDRSWGVDDGMGYRFNSNDKQQYGNPYTYVAYYAHWTLWYKRFMPMLLDFSKAAMLTRYATSSLERKKSQSYADAAIVMLDRIADLYPTLHVSEFPRNGYFGFPNNGFRWHTNISAGRIVGSIWENELIKDIMFAYDAVFPAIDKLSASAQQILIAKSHRPDKGNSAVIKANFENGVLRQVASAFADADLQGNPGMQQSSLALAAVVMDHYPETNDWLNIVYRNGNSDWGSSSKRDGGSILRYIVNRVSRDGQGDEVSVAYNAGWLANWSVVAKVLDGYHLPGGGTLSCGADPDLYHNARFRKLFEANYPYLLTDNYVPHIGDTSLTGCPGYKGNPDYDIINPDNLILAYNKYREPGMAQAIYMLKGHDIKRVHADIFSENPEAIQQNIRQVVADRGALQLGSYNFTAYGLGVLRDGIATATTTTQRALWMFYGACAASHNHADPLNLGYIGYDLDLMPDFGYPNTLGGDLNPEQQWDKSTPAHNTVSFADLGYRGHVVCYGRPLHFDDTPMVKLMHASADGVQNSNIPYAKQYDRTSALIRIDGSRSYIVDFFHVVSPRRYQYNFHTAEVDEASTRYHSICMSGADTTYNEKTLRRVCRAYTPASTFSIDWNILDTWNRYGLGQRAKTDVHLKMTMVGNYPDVHLGQAVPPTNNGNNPHWVPVLMVASKGATLFSSVIEPYKGCSSIRSVEQVPVMCGDALADSSEVKAIRVQLDNGRTDYIVCNLHPGKQYRIAGKFDFNGFFGVVSVDVKGKIQGRYLNDGTQIADKHAVDRVEGKVTDATNILSNHNTITVKLGSRIDVRHLMGRYIYVDNTDITPQPYLFRYNAVYPIRSAQYLKDGTYRLGIGDCSPIRGWKDVNKYTSGYVRDFSINAKCYIVLNYCDVVR